MSLCRPVFSFADIGFADDTNLFFNSGSFTELFKKANEELHEIDFWLIANRLPGAL